MVSSQEGLGQTLVQSYQDGRADRPCRFSSHCDGLWVPTKGLDVVLHPPQGCQLVQETPVALSVVIPGAVDEENPSLPRINLQSGGKLSPPRHLT